MTEGRARRVQKLIRRGSMASSAMADAAASARPALRTSELRV